MKRLNGIEVLMVVVGLITVVAFLIGVGAMTVYYYPEMIVGSIDGANAIELANYHFRLGEMQMMAHAVGIRSSATVISGMALMGALGLFLHIMYEKGEVSEIGA